MSAPSVQSATPLAAATAATRAGVFSRRWIVGPRADLAWFFAPAVVCYALLALYASGSRLVPLVFAGVVLLLDASHVFATYTRTYLDREERRDRRRLLVGSLALFLVGPAAVLAGQGARFFALASLWAYYHQARQHYGFAIIYKIKNGDLAPADNALDRLLLALGFACPLFVFLARNTNALARVPAQARTYAAYAPAALLAVTITVACVWLARQVQKFAQGEPLDAPKLLLFAAALPLYWAAALTGATREIAVLVLLTSPLHTLPYHRLVWFHNRKYADGDDRARRHGAAEFVSRRLLIYVAFILALSLGYHGLRRALFAAGGHGSVLAELALAFLLGHLLVHFYLDSKIWRVRRDPTVGRSLSVS